MAIHLGATRRERKGSEAGHSGCSMAQQQKLLLV